MILTLRDPAFVGQPVLAGIPVTSGLVAQWEADALSLSDGDRVASWPDQSGLSRTATNGNSTTQPSFKTNIWGTKPALFFDSARTDRLVYTPISLSSFSVFVVLKPDFTSVGAYNLAPLTWGDAGMNGFWLNGSASAGVGVPHITCRNTAGSETQNKIMSGVSWGSLTKHIGTWTYDGTTVTGRSDGVAATVASGEANYGTNTSQIGFNY